MNWNIVKFYPGFGGTDGDEAESQIESFNYLYFLRTLCDLERIYRFFAFLLKFRPIHRVFRIKLVKMFNI